MTYADIFVIKSIANVHELGLARNGIGDGGLETAVFAGVFSPFVRVGLVSGAAHCLERLCVSC